MKILFVLTYYRPHWTGLTQYAARVAEGLAERGHQVEVLCSQHTRQLPQKETLSKVAVYRLPYLFRFLRSVFMPGLPSALLNKILKNEVVVVYLPFQEVLLVAILAKIFQKKLFLVHNGDLVLPKGGKVNRLVEKIYFWLTAFATSFSNGILIQSEDYARSSKLLLLFRTKWRVVLPLFEVPQTTLGQVQSFLKKNGLEGKLLIGFSGRFVEEKGVDFLLKAIPLVKEKMSKAHFVFAGDYQVKYEKFWEKIKPLIAENTGDITLLGLVRDPQELFAFYKSLSVYVQPSRTDCFPSSQIEALLTGTPSVCTDIPGARQAVKETGMGEIVAAQNPEALAQGIVQVLKDRKRYQENFPKVKKIFDYQDTLRAYEQLFIKD